MKKWYDEEYKWEIEVIGFNHADSIFQRIPMTFSDALIPKRIDYITAHFGRKEVLVLVYVAIPRLFSLFTKRIHFVVVTLNLKTDDSSCVIQHRLWNWGVSFSHILFGLLNQLHKFAVAVNSSRIAFQIEATVSAFCSVSFIIILHPYSIWRWNI